MFIAAIIAVLHTQAVGNTPSIWMLLTLQWHLLFSLCWGKQLCLLQVSLLVSVIYLVLGVLRLGFVTHFLSRPIISAFLTAGTIIISLSQVRHTA